MAQTVDEAKKRESDDSLDFAKCTFKDCLLCVQAILAADPGLTLDKLAPLLRCSNHCGSFDLTVKFC